MGEEVGHVTLISGEGAQAVRTGVSAVLPRGKGGAHPGTHTVPAAWFSLNGNGEMTGTAWIGESGGLAGPIMLTNTHSVGVVRDAVVAWGQARGWAEAWSLPVVAETYDGFLNDINGFHVTREHAFAALDAATGGPVVQGNVGGGTGTIAVEWCRAHPANRAVVYERSIERRARIERNAERLAPGRVTVLGAAPDAFAALFAFFLVPLALGFAVFLLAPATGPAEGKPRAV